MLGNLLRFYREQNEITLRGLAETIAKNSPDGKEINYTVLSQYENGRYKLSKERMQAILQYGFGLTAQDAKRAISKYLAEQEILSMPEDDRPGFLHTAMQALKDRPEIEKSNRNIKNTLSSSMEILDVKGFIPVYSSLLDALTSQNMLEYTLPIPPVKELEESDRENLCWVLIGDKYYCIQKNSFEIVNGKKYVIDVNGRLEIRELFEVSEEAKKKVKARVWASMVME